MTKAYVEEYAYLAAFGLAGGQAFQAGHQPPVVAPQVVDYTSGHAESAAFNAKTKFIRVHVDSIASYRVSTAGTAATTSYSRMAANQTEYFAVQAGDIISFITNT